MRLPSDTGQGWRLDRYVAVKVPEYTRSTIEKFIDQGFITVNGNTVKTSYKISLGDKVDINPPEVTIAEIDIPIIHEDDNVIVLNKPAGVLTHSKGAFNEEGTVASFIAPKIDEELRTSGRGGIVHRLDRDTSGVIICAKNTATQTLLQKQFADRKTKKIYIAIAEGLIEDDVAILKWPIGRNPKKPQTFRVDANGKTAETEIEVIDRNEISKLTLVKLMPKTGRTHQLRVHLTNWGFPILGDRLYGKEEDRLWLHAESLEITIPTSDRRIFTAPLPETFTSKME